MDPLIKAILNNLKCPICQSRVDLYNYGKKMDSQYNFCCSLDSWHYRMWFPHWDKPPLYDIVVIYEGNYRYNIDQRYSIAKTFIDIIEVDAEFNMINVHLNKTFQYDRIMFDYPNTDRDKMINRIKTILTFQ
jgi:hypothetical protein